MHDTKDTIVALATPPGIGGIAIVRMSGPKARKIASKVFVPFRKEFKWKHRYLHYGLIIDKDEHIDQVLVSYFKAPHSYSGEDIIEINCHGGTYVSQRIVDLLIRNGARMAEPGEFSKRAFLNGRLDLSQAEAVVDVIHAQSEQSLHASVLQLEGFLYQQVSELQQSLTDIRLLLELELDFSEENIELANRDEILERIRNVKQKMQNFIDSYERGRYIREGVHVAIVGRPNVGKSSLLNALLKKDRAIVTEIPGTTRDTIEETIELNGILFRLTDTAGIIETSDAIEKEGIVRTYRAIENADVIILLFDSSEPLTEQDRFIISEVISRAWGDGINIVIAFNKSDLNQLLSHEDLENELSAYPIYHISARTMQNVEELENYLIETVTKKKLQRLSANVEVPLTRYRHLEAFRAAHESLEHAEKAMRDGYYSEFIAFDIKQASDHLGEIIGTVTSEKLLNQIFDLFCIGK